MLIILKRAELFYSQCNFPMKLRVDLYQLRSVFVNEPNDFAIL